MPHAAIDANNRRRSGTTICAGIAIAMTAGAGHAAITIVKGTDPTKYAFVGHLVTPDELPDAKLIVEGDSISCAGACTTPPGVTTVTVTNGYIFPGFIDAHNHVAYNVLGKWSPPKLYVNRGQWQRLPAYAQFKAPYNTLKKSLFCEMVKYGEIKSLLSGITTIQGTAPSSICFRTLVRNAENQNELGLPANHVRTFILDISSFRGSVDWSRTRSFVVHLAEGIDDRSRAEFDTLKSKGLLTSATAIIHGTAFGEPEFREMAQVGAKLVWSPRSNLILYDRTTDIGLAYKHGVPVSLGVDWNPTGSDNLFDELRVAAQVNEERFQGAIPEKDWVRLVTVNPADALALGQKIGSLRSGMKADIAVLRVRGDNPNKSLLATRLQDVQMVWIGGKLLYGNRAAVDRLRPGQCEAMVVNGSSKAICVADERASVPLSGQTLSTIRTKLLAKHPSLAPLY